ATSTVLSASRARKWARRCAVQSLANAYGWSSPDDICARGQCSVAPSAPEDGDARSRYFYERGRRVYCLCIWATIKSRYSFQVAAMSCTIYSIISSARARSEGETLSPRVFAVLRLSTSSYLVGACTVRP